jgi:hypothetical protein
MSRVLKNQQAPDSGSEIGAVLKGGCGRRSENSMMSFKSHQHEQQSTMKKNGPNQSIEGNKYILHKTPDFRRYGGGMGSSAYNFAESTN